MTLKDIIDFIYEILPDDEDLQDFMENIVFPVL